MLAEPRPTPSANPELPAALLITAALGLEEVHHADCRVEVLPSLNVPVATNGWIPPTTMEVLADATAIDTSPDGVRLPG
jgi:hypothetical protein